MSGTVVSIDLSLRCAGVVALNRQGELLDFLLLPTKKEEHDAEELLLHVEQSIVGWIATLPDLHAIVLEGLSFGAKSSSADMIAGNYWNLRKEIKVAFPEVLLGRVPVESWRSWVLPKRERAKAKEIYGKDFLKIAVAERLPDRVKQRFLEYLKANKYPSKGLYDLSDAYWLGQYRLSLEE